MAHTSWVQSGHASCVHFHTSARSHNSTDAQQAYTLCTIKAACSKVAVAVTHVQGSLLQDKQIQTTTSSSEAGQTPTTLPIRRIEQLLRKSQKTAGEGTLLAATNSHHGLEFHNSTCHPNYQQWSINLRRFDDDIHITTHTSSNQQERTMCMEHYCFSWQAEYRLLMKSATAHRQHLANTQMD
jgi:cytosine/adenosine deaminase-related metal-dependent hydrolase